VFALSAWWDGMQLRDRPDRLPEGLGPFGAAGDIAVQRGIAEFQAGRPVVVADASERVVALPVDGLTETTWNAFTALCRPMLPGLIITKRRARVLGLEAAAPLLIPLTAEDTHHDVWSLAAGLQCERRKAVGMAGAAAAGAIDLAKLAQRFPALLAIPAEVVAPDTLAQMIVVAAHDLARVNERILDTLEFVSEARIPLPDGADARFCVFRDAVGSSPVAIILGDPDFSKPVNVRVHYLEQEGRGLGLANKMRAYMLQDDGLDTMDANMMLGFDDDERNYGVAARMLKMLGVSKVQLLTNNPGKLEALSDGGVEVCARIALHTEINPENRRYLATKAARAGHLLDDMLEAAEPRAGRMTP
jgi:GTP cyclohydrolase II